MTSLLGAPTRADRSFERLYRRHAPDVYRYALGVLRNPADAEDVTQTTFLNAYRALERGEEPRAPHNWLIAIAHNVCRQRFRAASRRPQEVELEADVAEQLVADDDTPSREDILRALGHLELSQRSAIVLREIEGRSYADIAEVLGLSVSAVETLIFRARRALREQLEGSLTCSDAELAISRQLDGRLSRADKGQLRAHLRECAECRTFARRQRAQRTALRSLGGIPLPSSLAGLFGGGGATVAGIAAKAAAVVATAGVVGGVGYDLHQARQHPQPPQHPASHVRRAVVTRPPAAVAPAEPRVEVRASRSAVVVRLQHHAAPRPAHRSSPPAATTTETVPAAPPALPAQPAPAAARPHGHGRPAQAPGRQVQAQAQAHGRGHGQAHAQHAQAHPQKASAAPVHAGGVHGGRQNQPPGQDGGGRPGAQQPDSGSQSGSQTGVTDPVQAAVGQAQATVDAAQKKIVDPSASFPPDRRLHP